MQKTKYPRAARINFIKNAPPERPAFNTVKKNIVILGAGFAGLRTALDLASKIHAYPDYQLTLVNKTDVHLYTPDLYEIATAYYPTITSTCLTRLKETVATKIISLIPKNKVIFLHDTVKEIQPEKRKVLLEKQGSISYEYLVVALGSVTNYYNIPGLEQFSYPLKTVADALAIQCHLDSYFQTLWRRHIKKSVHIVVGGGGATGCELAAELPTYIKKLCKKYNYPPEQVDITIIEGKNEPIGLGSKLAKRVMERFAKFRIITKLGTRLIEAKPEKVRIKDKAGVISEIAADMVIWTGGVMPHPLVKESFQKVSGNGALEVNKFLEARNYPKVFACGDNAFFINPKTGSALPLLAQIAKAQGRIAATNIIADITGKRKIPYVPKIKGVIIPLGGKYAVLKREKICVAGFWIWVSRRLVDLGYAISIMTSWRALRKWWRATNIFVQND